jgi:hypothetical protein
VSKYNPCFVGETEKQADDLRKLVTSVSSAASQRHNTLTCSNANTQLLLSPHNKSPVQSARSVDAERSSGFGNLTSSDGLGNVSAGSGSIVNSARALARLNVTYDKVRLWLPPRLVRTCFQV